MFSVLLLKKISSETFQPNLSIYSIVLGTVRAPHDLATNSRHSSRSSALLKASLSFKPIQSRMLSSHHFLCLPLLLPPPTVLWRTALASPEALVTCPYHFILRPFTVDTFFVGSNGLLNPASHLLVGDVVFDRDAKETSETSHFHCLYLSLYFCC